MDKRQKVEQLLIAIMIPVFVGFFAGAIAGNSTIIYENLQKPSFSPPAGLFPSVWTILYVLMGVSSFLIYQSESPLKQKALKVYIFQLSLNFFWSILFFNLNYQLAAFLWIIMLIVAVIVMIVLFSKINPLAALLQVPYLVWIIFAAVLNYSIYQMNR